MKLIRFYYNSIFLNLIFRYTKTVVDSSLNAQRYNPEFTITMSSTPATYSGNTNTSALIDQLRHINQVST